jgi:hypothetical protein
VKGPAPSLAAKEGIPHAPVVVVRTLSGMETSTILYPVVKNGKMHVSN